jgi:Zn-dependent protease with chaperone function
MRVVILIAALGLMLSISGSAQTPDASPSANTSAQPTPMPAVQTHNGPVAVPTPSEKAMNYYHGNIALWIFSTILGFLIPALFLFTGFSARIRNWSQAIGEKWFFIIDTYFHPREMFSRLAKFGKTQFFTIGIYFAIFTIISSVISLPLDYYQGFVREHAYGLSDQAFGKWFSDELTGLAVGIVTGVLFLWVPYLLLKKSPQRWWLYTGLLTIPFLFFAITIQPVFIDPLFNDFGPMKDKALEAKILALAERAGIEGSRVYEVNKSADTKHLNAYVTGFGNTKRIVMWDTLLKEMNEREVLCVMGHEMGHYVLGHVWKSILFFSLVILLTLYAIHRTAQWMLNKYRHRFGFSELSDIASLPLIMLLFGVYIFIVTPAVLAFTRHAEHEADRFALEITHDNHAMATAFTKFVTNDLDNPRPNLLIKLWQKSHPTTGERIDFVNEYRPWEKNQPLEYDHLFKNPK